MHLSQEELVRWRDEAPAGDRERVLTHLAGCDDCGAALADLMRTRPADTPPVHLDPARFIERGLAAGAAGIRLKPDSTLAAGAAGVGLKPDSTRWRRVASGFSRTPPAVYKWVPLAAAAALLIAALVPFMRSPPPAPTSTERGQAIAIVSPRGDVAPPLVFAWSPVEGAARYLVEIYDADRRLVASGTTRDTRWSPPADVAGRLVPGREFGWSVSAQTASGDSIETSRFERFIVTRP